MWVIIYIYVCWPLQLVGSVHLFILIQTQNKRRGDQKQMFVIKIWASTLRMRGSRLRNCVSKHVWVIMCVCMRARTQIHTYIVYREREKERREDGTLAEKWQISRSAGLKSSNKIVGYIYKSKGNVTKFHLTDAGRCLRKVNRLNLAEEKANQEWLLYSCMDVV